MRMLALSTALAVMCWGCIQTSEVDLPGQRENVSHTGESRNAQILKLMAHEGYFIGVYEESDVDVVSPTCELRYNITMSDFNELARAGLIEFTGVGRAGSYYRITPEGRAFVK